MNDLIILAMMLAGPKHGYQLKNEAGLIFGQQALHNNIVYPLLQRFMEEGWASRKETPGERGQTRQQYSLTARGRKYLLERLNQFEEADAASDDKFRFRVAMFELMSPETREKMLTLREGYLENMDRRMAGIESGFELDSYPCEVVRQLREHIALERKWVPRLRRLSKSIRKRAS